MLSVQILIAVARRQWRPSVATSATRMANLTAFINSGICPQPSRARAVSPGEPFHHLDRTCVLQLRPASIVSVLLATISKPRVCACAPISLSTYGLVVIFRTLNGKERCPPLLLGVGAPFGAARKYCSQV